MRILDIGCGWGSLINNILYKKGYCVGIDILPWFKSNLRTKSPDCDFLLCDCQDLCFQNQSFDQVYCYDVLEHVEDSEKAISEFARVLRNKGELSVSVPHPRSEKICIFLEPSYYGLGMHLRVFDLSLLENLMIRKGLTIVEVKNDDFFSAIALTYRLMRKIPFETQSGYTLKKDIILLFLQLLACLSDPPSWTTLEQELRKRGLLRLYYPLLRLGGPIRLFEVSMSRIYPKTTFIRAVKMEEKFNQP